MVKRWRAIFMGAVGCGLALAMACGPGFLDGITGGDAGGGGPGDARACTLVTIPPPPETPDLQPNTDVLFAFEAIRIDTRPDAVGQSAPQGLDLDDRCTCPEPPTCAPFDPKTTQCDFDGGRDNALGGLFNTLGDLVGGDELKSDFATKRIATGEFTFLVDLKQWNGTDNDPSVVVDLLGSEGYDSSDGGSGRSTPAFDGKDVWTVSARSIQDGNNVLGKDCRDPRQVFCFPVLDRRADGALRNAWVSNGVLVAKFADAPVLVATAKGPILFDINRPTLVARIERPEGGDRYFLRGEVTGSWASERVLRSFGDLEDFSKVAEAGRQRDRLCTNRDLYSLLKSQVCINVDLPPPGSPADAPCNVLSSAFAFTAGQTVRPSRVYRGLESDAAACPRVPDDCTR
jgi:hypothetical protein